MAAKAGVCPAAKEKRLNGVHCGKNAGRACWAVAGTFAKGNIVGSFAGRHKSCISCKFYQMVKVEEGKYFWPVPLMHKIMR